MLFTKFIEQSSRGNSPVDLSVNLSNLNRIRRHARSNADKTMKRARASPALLCLLLVRANNLPGLEADEAPLQRKVMDKARGGAAGEPLNGVWAPTAEAESVALGPHAAVRMPRVGFGCASNIHERELVAALSAGYRLFDTAQSTQWGYDEPALASALAKTGVSRSDVFITTKIHPKDFGPTATPRAIADSLRRLGTTRIDAVLLHYAQCWGNICDGAPPPEGTWRDAWAALAQARADGTVRAIGVSNFHVPVLQQLVSFGRTLSVPGAVDLVQDWCDPLHQAAELRSVCHAHGIAFQAYSLLQSAGWKRKYGRNMVLTHPVIASIGEEQHASPALVVLAWALAREIAVLPRSTTADHLTENLKALSLALSAQQLERIDALDGTEGDPWAA